MRPTGLPRPAAGDIILQNNAIHILIGVLKSLLRRNSSLERQTSEVPHHMNAKTNAIVTKMQIRSAKRNHNALRSIIRIAEVIGSPS